MDRMPPIPAEKLTVAQKQAIDDFRTLRIADCREGPWVPLLRSPEAMTRAQALGHYYRYNTGLPPKLSEFIILLTAGHWTQPYEWKVHYPIAIEAGVARDVATAIQDGRRPASMSEEEDVLYDFCTELQQTRRVTDATYARALARFGEKGVIDIVGIVGYYTFLAMVLNATTSDLQ